MMPCTLLRLQLMETFGNRRRTVVRIGVGALLAMPFIFAGMPASVKASGIVMVVLFTAFFGSAIAQARMCEDGRLARLRMLPMWRGMLWLDLILASAIGRMVPTAVIVGGFAAFNSAAFDGAVMIHAAALLCAAVLLLTALGTLTGQLARSNGEVHLFCALICGVIAFVCGVIPGVQRLTPLTYAMRWNPLSRLLSALTGLTNGTMTVSAPELILSSVVLGLFMLTVIGRWTAGRQRAMA